MLLKLYAVVVTAILLFIWVRSLLIEWIVGAG